MNANELIAELKERHLQGCIYQEAADMLRQQQEKLTKYELRHAEQRKRIEELEAKTLTGAVGSLSDEEINQVAIDMGMFGDLSHDEIELCRNVLRKAQER